MDSGLNNTATCMILQVSTIALQQMLHCETYLVQFMSNLCQRDVESIPQRFSRLWCGVVVAVGFVKIFTLVIALQQLGIISSLCPVHYSKICKFIEQYWRKAQCTFLDFTFHILILWVKLIWPVQQSNQFNSNMVCIVKPYFSVTVAQYNQRSCVFSGV